LKSISNRNLKLLRKLNRKKYRRKEQLFLAEVARTVEQIIDNKIISVEELFFDENQHFCEQPLWEPVAKAVESSLVPERDFATVSDTANPQGVIALCHIPPEINLTELANRSGVIIAADAIQDPGNMGTIIRTACWFGATGFLSGKGTVDLFHPKVVRATAGATGVVSYANVNLQKSLPVFEQQDWKIIL